MAGFAKIVVPIALVFAALPGMAAPLPHLELSRLNGTSFALPEDLGAKTSALAIGFTRSAGSKSRAWTDRLEKDFGDRPGFAAYGVAVLAAVPRLFRPLALAGIEKSVPAEGRDRFLIALTDEAEWKALVGYESPDDPYILVMDRQGEVIAEGRGPLGDAAYRKLAGEIDRALSGERKER
jgi:hypothetical protein